MHAAPAIVFIVDDDADVRRALQRLLRSAAYETRAFGSATGFLAAHDPGVVGCVILDLAMPDLNGLEVQAALATSGCHRPIVFLTGNGSIATSVCAMRAGAVNFLTKPVENGELFAAVEEALKIDIAERSIKSLRHAAAGRLGTLTPRERQVLDHVVAGRLNKQIAADLGTVEKTIKVHRARVMQKMGTRSLAELVRLAVCAGIASAERGAVGAVPEAEARFIGGSAADRLCVQEGRAIDNAIVNLSSVRAQWFGRRLAE